MEELPCIVYPIGHDQAGSCLARLDGLQALAANAEDGGGADKPIPPNVSPDTHPLCLVQRVVDFSPGQPALYRNWCTPDAPPAPLPETINQLTAARRLLALGADTCPRGTQVSVDADTGRLRCVAPVADPCRSALVPSFGEDGAMHGYTCAPAAAAGHMLPNPCPAGTWLMPDPARGPSGASFVCRNPCPEGQAPNADGSGTYVCQ